MVRFDLRANCAVAQMRINPRRGLTSFVFIIPTVLSTGPTHSVCDFSIIEGINLYRQLSAHNGTDHHVLGPRGPASQRAEGPFPSSGAPTPAWLHAEHASGPSLWELSHFCGFLSFLSLVPPKSQGSLFLEHRVEGREPGSMALRSDMRYPEKSAPRLGDEGEWARTPEHQELLLLHISPHL